MFISLLEDLTNSSSVRRSKPMKRNRLYALAATDQLGGLFHSKLFVAFLILALLFASLPAMRVLAAPASGQGVTENKNLEPAWRAKQTNLRWAGYYYDHVHFFPADFERPADLARVQWYLEKYGIALRAANTILQRHAGFDIEGNVINEVQADQSIRNLAMYLQMMRGIRDKIEEVTKQ
jgi:hypothetical protein